MVAQSTICYIQSTFPLAEHPKAASQLESFLSEGQEKGYIKIGGRKIISLLCDREEEPVFHATFPVKFS